MPGVLERKEKATPFGVSLMRSQVLYRAAQAWCVTQWKSNSALCISCSERRASSLLHAEAIPHFVPSVVADVIP